MVLTIVISAITVLAIILSLLIKPNFHIKGRSISFYWVFALVGAIALIATGSISLDSVASGLTSSNAVNPLKLLAIFLSMTALSVFLDEMGFFEYLAGVAVAHANTDQRVLFRYLYLLVSVLTVFTSNDIVILTFTPFIMYFSKRANVNPLPFLIAEFVAANTLSMALIIGNPTNIYVASNYGVDFLRYAEIMLIPSVASAIVGYIVLRIVFRKQLNEPMFVKVSKKHVTDKFLTIVGIVHLGVCILLLAISSYIGLEMWYLCVGALISLVIVSGVYMIVKRIKPTVFWHCLHRLPYELVPFVVSMFVVALALDKCGLTTMLGNALGDTSTIWVYGGASLLGANVFNNIPMSVLFSSVMGVLSGGALEGATFATIIGSNIGAYLTPIGALAGIMWLNIVKRNGENISFLRFMKYGVVVAIPVMIVALLGLMASLAIF